MNGPEVKAGDLPDPSEFPQEELGSLAQEARVYSLRSARTTMYVIGGLTIVLNLGMAIFAEPLVESQIRSEINALNQQGMMVDDEQVAAFKQESIRDTQVSGVAFAGLGVIFFVLGAFIYKNPVLCTVMALVLYLAGQAMTAIADPTLLARGIIVKVIILAALVKAIQAATAYRREQLASEAAKKLPV